MRLLQSMLIEQTCFTSFASLHFNLISFEKQTLSDGFQNKAVWRGFDQDLCKQVFALLLVQVKTSLFSLTYVEGRLKFENMIQCAV